MNALRVVALCAVLSWSVAQASDPVDAAVASSAAVASCNACCGATADAAEGSINCMKKFLMSAIIVVPLFSQLQRAGVAGQFEIAAAAERT